MIAEHFNEVFSINTVDTGMLTIPGPSRMMRVIVLNERKLICDRHFLRAKDHQCFSDKDSNEINSLLMETSMQMCTSEKDL